MGLVANEWHWTTRYYKGGNMKKYLTMSREKLILVIYNTKNPKLKLRLIRILTLKSMGLIDKDGNLRFDPPD